MAATTTDLRVVRPGVMERSWTHQCFGVSVALSFRRHARQARESHPTDANANALQVNCSGVPRLWLSWSASGSFWLALLSDSSSPLAMRAKITSTGSRSTDETGGKSDLSFAGTFASVGGTTVSVVGPGLSEVSEVIGAEDCSDGASFSSVRLTGASFSASNSLVLDLVVAGDLTRDLLSDVLLSE